MIVMIACVDCFDSYSFVPQEMLVSILWTYYKEAMWTVLGLAYSSGAFTIPMDPKVPHFPVKLVMSCGQTQFARHAPRTSSKK